MLELPEDLVDEILCRVPAISLKRLQYTCKRWNCLLNDSKFSRKHFDKAPKEYLFLINKKLGFYSMTINLNRSPHADTTCELNTCSNLTQFTMSQYSQYCDSSDGLLLFICCVEKNIRLMVWNPCIGQTRWIQSENSYRHLYNYALGSYQDKNSGKSSYKILSQRIYTYGDHKGKLKIYEMNSNSWRVLDITMDYVLLCFVSMSLKGKTYWIARDKKEKQLGIFLVSFDYTTESFERLCLPYQCLSYQNMCLSVVKEEKLSTLLQHELSSKTEIWVTNKIGETKVVSWIKVLAVDLKPELGIWNLDSFLVDEEKKILVYIQCSSRDKVYLVGEDNKVKEVVIGVEGRPYLFYYVPSLTQVQ